ncbi:hypothetical protein SUGI_1225870 [Cryptomeria japonica]|uniref:Uncharacterized protein n=1 Tax=Cryptomeria japonica TaxID=3369 RepID=A0AAD3RNU0_CRYJA|nr:hypothetical protein SUGI_1225870 [Cryptomeria japonica]
MAALWENRSTWYVGRPSGIRSRYGGTKETGMGEVEEEYPSTEREMELESIAFSTHPPFVDCSPDQIILRGNWNHLKLILTILKLLRSRWFNTGWGSTSPPIILKSKSSAAIRKKNDRASHPSLAGVRQGKRFGGRLGESGRGLCTRQNLTRRAGLSVAPLRHQMNPGQSPRHYMGRLVSVATALDRPTILQPRAVQTTTGQG